MREELRELLETPGSYGTNIHFSTFADYMFVISRGIRNEYDHLKNSQFFVAQLIENAFLTACLEHFPTRIRRPIENVTEQADFELHTEDDDWIQISFKHSAVATQGRLAIWFALRWDDVDPPRGYGAECPMLIFLSRGTNIAHRAYDDLQPGFYYTESEDFNETLAEFPLRVGSRTHSGFSYMNCRAGLISPQAITLQSPSNIDLDSVGISFNIRI